LATLPLLLLTLERTSCTQQAASLACLQGCSGHGACGGGGSCVCSPGWEGWDCRYNLPQTLSATEEGVQEATKGLQALTQLANSQYTASKPAASSSFLGYFAKPLGNTAFSTPEEHHHALLAGPRVQNLAGVAPQRSAANRLTGASMPALIQARGAALAAQAAAHKLLQFAKQANDNDAHMRIQRAIQKARRQAKDFAGGEFAEPNASLSLLAGASSGVANASDLACGLGQGCSGHGTCDPLHGGCQCGEGWRGTLCDVVACPDDCSNNGVCIGGKCMCKSTHVGAGCQNLRCLHDCSSRGYCFEGRCQCEDGYGGEGCTELLESSRVVRLEVPQQRPGLRGLATLEASTIRSAQQVACPSGCMGRGTCLKSGRCLCAGGWTGAACSDFCPEDCSGHGSCSGGACLCNAGYQGTDCASQAVLALEVAPSTPPHTCPMACSGHGACTEPGICMCKAGWLGVACNHRNNTYFAGPTLPATSSDAAHGAALASLKETAGDEVDAEQPQHFSGHLRDDAAPQTAPWIPMASEGKNPALAQTLPNSQLSFERPKGKPVALLSVAAGPPQHKGRVTLASLLSAAAQQGRKQAISAPVPATKPGPQPTERQQHQEQ